MGFKMYTNHTEYRIRHTTLSLIIMMTGIFNSDDNIISMVKKYNFTIYEI